MTDLRSKTLSQSGASYNLETLKDIKSAKNGTPFNVETLRDLKSARSVI